MEDEIEAQRQQKVAELKRAGKGTPITPETFAAWQEAKRKRRSEEAKKKVEAEFKKKKGGKGLAVLSGRELYEYRKEMFDVKDDDVDDQNDDNDDDDDDDGDNYENNNSKDGETKNKNDIMNGEKEDCTAHKNNVEVKEVEEVAAKVQSDLFLEGDDEDLDDLDDE